MRESNFGILGDRGRRKMDSLYPHGDGGLSSWLSVPVLLEFQAKIECEVEAVMRLRP